MAWADEVESLRDAAFTEFADVQMVLRQVTKGVFNTTSGARATTEVNRAVTAIEIDPRTVDTGLGGGAAGQIEVRVWQVKVDDAALAGETPTRDWYAIVDGVEFRVSKVHLMTEDNTFVIVGQRSK